MKINSFYPDYEIVRDASLCCSCRICEKQCANGVHSFDENTKRMLADNSKCVVCHRCVDCCPTSALKIVKSGNTYKNLGNFSKSDILGIYRQAESGGMLLSSMGTQKDSVPVYFDKMLLNASQVTNPSIDPLREPMETRTFLGSRKVSIQRNSDGAIKPNLGPNLTLSTPIMFSAMSFGSISFNAHCCLARAAQALGTYYNCGEGGLHEELYEYKANTIVQVASGRFGVHRGYLDAGAAVEIKIGQGAKPGIGGHLPGAKMTGDVSRTRMVPEHSDAISPAPHHDIYSIEDLRQLVMSLKAATGGKKPVIVKIAAVHNAAEIASGIARSGADVIAIDGFRGGTGAAPCAIRDNVGIPIELALACIDERLRNEGIRDRVSLVAGGSIRSSADVVKALALGADAVYIGTAALMALGCHLCASCQSGLCNWGIATVRPDLATRLDVQQGTERLINLVTAWTNEIKEFMGAMGINAVEALRGNRRMLRGVDLTDRELSVLGIKQAGE